MKILFFGSSEFSLSALQACLDQGHEIVLVITTPDQKKGRGLHLAPTIVKQRALEMNLPVESPASLKDEALLARAADLKPELMVVASYGKFIPSSWLKIPSVLCINVHPSLIPRYRGASPIHRPILNGDAETGITLMEVTARLDSGDVFAQEHVALSEDMDAERLSCLLAERSYHVLQKVLDQVREGKLTRTPQKEEDATYAEKLSKEEGRVSFSEPAVQIARKVRGLQPWPGVFTSFENAPLQILQARAMPGVDAAAGTLLEINRDGSIVVATGDGALRIEKVKPAGKKVMGAADFVRGRRLAPGFVFSI